MSSTRDNTYTNTNNRTFYLSDDVDNESIGKLMWYILYQIREDDKTLWRKRMIKQLAKNKENNNGEPPSDTL